MNLDILTNTAHLQHILQNFQRITIYVFKPDIERTKVIGQQGKKRGKKKRKMHTEKRKKAFFTFQSKTQMIWFYQTKLKNTENCRQHKL